MFLMIVGVFLLVGALLKPKSRAFAILIAGYMFLMYGFNTYTGDYQAYEAIYDGILSEGIGHYELFFSILMFGCAKCGLSFLGFRIVLSLLYTVLCYKAVTKYTPYRAVAMVLCLIFPFPYYISVLRSGIAAALLLFSLQYLYKGGKKNMMRFVLLLICAVFFHYSSIVFFGILFVRKKMNYRYLFLVFCGVAALFVAFMNIDVIGAFLSRFTDRAKTLQWFSSAADLGLNWKGIAFQILIVFSNVFLNEWNVKTLRKIYNGRDGKLCVSTEEQRRFRLWFADFAYKAGWMIVIFIPFMFMTDIAMRFVWAIIMPTICACSNTAYEITELRKKCKPHLSGRTPYILMVTCAFILLCLFFMNMPYMGTENSCMKLFYNNELNLF